ncbi:DUF4190 domain-containing protein [Nocardia sp. NBC_01329]|uniref:DUF4190 domain-containing protein n=1 Tax=Nocardia sp. NBC_01329 TaxID=2903594 RepID=UPI002E149265|nr:DUF4190 domain-containing protein [Nocardia sp. NBC_01329]
MSYPPPPGYPAPGPGPYPGPGGQPEYWQESPKRKGMAIAALVLGILGVLSFWTIAGGILFGLIAVILGVIALVKAKRGTGGGGIMAVIGLILGLLAIVGVIVVAIVGWGIWSDSGGRDFVDCVSNANGDQTAVSQCEDEFNQRIEDQYGVTIAPPEPTN